MLYGDSYRVKDTSLSTKLDMAKDGESEAVDSSETSSLRVEDISIFWIIDVVLQPGSAE